MSKTIRIATMGVADDYRLSVVPLIIQRLGYRLDWTSSAKADLIIFGPFFNRLSRLRWVPKPLRPAVDAIAKRLQSDYRPVTLFQTGENLRHNHIPCDFSLSFDLAVDNPRHCRFPYWMELVDWSHEGITGNTNPRFGRLLSLERLMHPLGNSFLKKPRRAAIFASHMREPRATLIRALERHVPVEGFGPVFDATITHHARSSFTKFDVLKNFAFNLCPENSMYPGYYTEKIPEAFMADCLPLTWADSNVSTDFLSSGFVNLAPMMQNDFNDLDDLLKNPARLAPYSDGQLLKQKPSLHEIKTLLLNILNDALT